MADSAALVAEARRLLAAATKGRWVWSDDELHPHPLDNIGTETPRRGYVWSDDPNDEGRLVGMESACVCGEHRLSAIIETDSKAYGPCTPDRELIAAACSEDGLLAKLADEVERLSQQRRELLVTLKSVEEYFLSSNYATDATAERHEVQAAIAKAEGK